MGKLRELALMVRDFACTLAEPIPITEMAVILDCKPREIEFLMALRDLLANITFEEGKIFPTSKPAQNSVQRPGNVEKSSQSQNTNITLESLAKTTPTPRDAGEISIRKVDFDIIGMFYQILEARPKYKRGEPIFISSRANDRKKTEQLLLEAAMRHGDWIEIHKSSAKELPRISLVFTERGHEVGKKIASYKRIREYPDNFPVKKFGFRCRVVPDDVEALVGGFV